ncbi:glycosyltransferase family 2 protein [Lacticaseibacillus camelliae]|uniref:glycosyltransferase family 2 protein n=1 Tax=Lacticaseibacillus camelliae TaxID=381742 RepID=UPI00138EDDB2|nr:glycosyltransferase family A protein [Lacticaseibacillus camelliae]
MIIPYNLNYGTDFERALSSVFTQIGVDLNQLEVIAVNDGGPALSEGITERWPLREYLMTESRGAGVARQTGLNHAHGAYAMFLDADDMLASPIVLHDFFKASRASPDVIVAPFWGESRAGEGVDYTLHAASDHSAVYAKAFRMGYLKRIGLTFHPSLRVYEDVYFTSLALDLTTSITRLTRPAYVWRLNWQSTGRRDHFSMAFNDAAWLQSGRYRLQFIQSHAADRWGHDFYELISGLYVHAKKYPPSDLAALKDEVRKLMAENRQWWQLHDAHALVRRLAIDKAQAQNLKSSDIDDYLDFLEEQT